MTAASTQPPCPPAPGRPGKARSRIVPAAVALLLLLHFGLAVGSKLHESTTSDEIAHLTAGFSYWRFNDYRLQPENGILPQRWEALPAWLEHAPFPALNQLAWRESDVWIVGYQFFYMSGRDHFPLLMEARAMAAVFSVGVGLLVFLWSRRLFGTAGGFISLILFAFSPEFLAHGGLATSDVCLCLFMLASVGAWWRHLHEDRGLWTAASAAAFALTFVAKFSCVLLPLMLGLLGLIRLCSPAPLRLYGRTARSVGGRAGLIALTTGVHALAAWVVIWAFFGFRFSAFNPALPPADHFLRDWSSLDPNLGLAGTVIHGLMRARLLPEAYLYGLAYVIDTSQIRAAFLNGNYSDDGWREFFPWAFALKTTLPLMIATLCALVSAVCHWHRSGAAGGATGRERAVAAVRSAVRDIHRVAPLVILFGVYWAFSIQSHLNIGHRHLLPTYPVLYIGAGLLGGWLTTRRWAPLAAAGGIAAWQVLECALVAPHFIAYFNELAGGPAGGRYHLVDSSLDWGQDLPGLKAWIDGNARPGEPVFLAYFGSGEPKYYGIHAQALDFTNGFHLFRPWTLPQPGLYCVSVTMLDQVYGKARGPWTAADEREYQALSRLAPEMQRLSAQSTLEGPDPRLSTPSLWRSINYFHGLQLARLCYYLRIRRPDASVGWSIYIYRLNQAEVTAATGTSVRAWSDLIERTIAAGGAADGGRTATP